MAEFIRPYNEGDKEAVIELLRLNTPEYFSPDEEQDFIYYLDNELEHYYVIELNNKVVGCGGINLLSDIGVGRISWDMLHPEHQEKGLGGMLLMYRLKEIKQFSHIKVAQVRTSQLAYKFYSKFGFQLKEVIKDYWAKGFDLYLMEHTLDQLN